MAEEKIETKVEEPTPETPDIKALQAEINRLKGENEKLRTSVTNASGEASKYKKQWQATLSEQEKKEAELAEQRAAELAELTQLKNEKRISGYKAKFMEVGYDAQTAETMASALPEGVSDNYFEVQKTFISGKVQNAKAEMLNTQPTLSAGANPSAKVAEEQEHEKLRKYFGLS